MSSDVSGQVVLITGGASGIGLAASRLLAQRGASVVVADRDADAAAQQATRIVDEGFAADARPVDVGESASVDHLITEVLATYGRLDAVVHCAAINLRKRLLDVTDDEWRTVLRVNLDGSFWVGRAAGRVMADAGVGTIVFLASDRGVLGSPEAGPYAASKGGVIALVKSLAMALGPKGVTVNAINPGTTDTPLARAGLTEQEWQARARQDPLGRLSRPEDIAEIVAFLCGPGRSIMTGQIVTTRMR